MLYVFCDVYWNVHINFLRALHCKWYISQGSREHTSFLQHGRRSGLTSVPHLQFISIQLGDCCFSPVARSLKIRAPFMLELHQYMYCTQFRFINGIFETDTNDLIYWQKKIYHMHLCIIGCNKHVLWAHIKDSSYIYNICKSVSHQIITNQNPICSDSTNNSLFYDFLFKLKFKHVPSQSSSIETNVDLQYFQYLHGFNFSIILSSSQIRFYIL